MRIYGVKAMYRRFVKRSIDIVLSACGLLILSPVYLILAAAVYVDDPGAVFFAQKRIGRKKNGKASYFQLYNIRAALTT